MSCSLLANNRARASIRRKSKKRTLRYHDGFGAGSLSASREKESTFFMVPVHVTVVVKARVRV